MSSRAPLVARVAPVIVVALAAAFAGACGDGQKKRAIGAACDVSSQCQSGICGGGQCLDPEVDTDGDGLVNRVEAALGTDPVASDSDGDGVTDGSEVGADVAHALDSDGDGKIDAIESATDDCDGDDVPDQDDPTDGTDSFGHCGGVVADPCALVCDAASSLGCEGFTSAQCLDECDTFRLDHGTTAACEAAFANVASCLVAAQSFICPAADTGRSSFPDVAGTACQSEAASYESCSGGTDTCSIDPEPLDVGITLDLQLSEGLPFEVLAVDTTAGVPLDVVLSQSGGTQDFATVQVTLYDASDPSFCVLFAGPGSGLPVGEDSTDTERHIGLAASDNPGSLQIYVAAGGAAHFKIQVLELAP
ncbi:MAG: hypothetical protein KC635_23660 [Myxococcales bacterium]|nr:hypothetical protein [Myxococcales bacterium]MCB9731366.1 hypothetical protein [Deltaproteobacteria bacterium]